MPPRKPGFFERRRIVKAQKNMQKELTALCNKYGITPKPTITEIRTGILSISEPHRRMVAEAGLLAIIKRSGRK